MKNTKTEAQRLADEALVEFQCGALSVLTGRKMIDELRRLVAENSDLRERNAALGNAQEIALDTATEHALAADELRSALTAAEAERDQLRAQLSKAVASKCELLEALDLMEKAQAHIDGLPMFPTTHATEGARFKLFDARQAARAAIAKATGERHE